MSGVLILCYHRVARLESDPHGIAVSPRHFAEHLTHLAMVADVLPLGRLPSRRRPGVVLTFDDGYADNAHEAREALLRVDMPATFFITTSQVGATAEFWWDRLERLVLDPTKALHRLDLLADGRPLSVDARTEEGRRRAHWALYWRLRRLDPDEIVAVLDEVEAQTGQPTADRSTHRIVDHEELQLLADEPFDVGGHTLRHPQLSTQSLQVQHREVTGSREVLEELTGRRVRSFAYPFGGTDAFDANTASLVADAGYERSCTTVLGTATVVGDPFQLPRMVVGDWDGDEFARRLAPWLERCLWP